MSYTAKEIQEMTADFVLDVIKELKTEFHEIFAQIVERIQCDGQDCACCSGEGGHHGHCSEC